MRRLLGRLTPRDQSGIKYLNPNRVCYLSSHGGSRRREQGAAGQGPGRDPENPESYENVPGHIIPIIEREFDDFDNEAEQFLSGELEENQFIGFRLKQGVYGQRQPDVQMIRDQASVRRGHA